MNANRIYLTGTEEVYLWNGQSFYELMRQLIENSSLSVEVVESPHQADIILFLEPCKWKDRSYIKLLSENLIFRNYAHKSYVYSIDDFSIAFLPGVYVNLEKRHHVRNFTLPCGYLFQANDLTESTYVKYKNIVPKYRACFRGTVNIPLRRKLIEADFHKNRPDYQINPVESNKWFKHDEDEKTSYLIEILNSKYVICPRGLGPASYRLFETMQLGRVPIIISDQWLPPYSLEWDSFSIRLKENQISSIPNMIEANEPRWGDMAKLARETWESHFAPTKQIDHLLNELILLSESPRPDADEYLRRWKKNSFWRPYGFGLLSKIKKRIHDSFYPN